MEEHVTKEDLRDTRDTIVAAMERGFDGVYRRQDLTNGRVNALEQDSTAVQVQVKNLEREVFRREPNPRGDRASITRRDVGVFVAGLLTLWAGLHGLAWLAAAVRPS